MQVSNYTNYNNLTDGYGFNNQTMQVDYTKQEQDTQKQKEIAKQEGIYIQNPYQDSLVSNEVWLAFVKASEGYNDLDTQTVQQALFEMEFPDSSKPIDMVDWETRTQMVKNHIYVAGAENSKIDEPQKIVIAEDIKQSVQNKIEILNNFQNIINGSFLPVDMLV